MKEGRSAETVAEVVKFVPGAKARPEQYHIHKADGFGDVLACDWRWPKNKPVWTMSTRCYMEMRWYDEGSPLTEDGRAMIISRFGIWKLASELPLSRIRLMSPAELMALRRNLEEKHNNLPKLHPESDRVGGHIPAELAA